MFDITKEDHLNIKLAEAVGVTHLAVSYPQDINCTLIKSSTKVEISKQCTNTTVVGCRNVEVVRVKNVTEDCSRHDEYCQYNFRTQEVTQDTIICQKPADVVCDPCERGQTCDEQVCERNTIVVCNTVHQTVAITERKQRCGLAGELVTTKICFTYPDASWVCRQARTDRDCDRESVRFVAHEVGQPRVQCSEKELEPLCLPANCRLRSNNTDCLNTALPKQIKLEDQICEPCKHGRTKLRPALVKEEVCDQTRIEEICKDRQPAVGDAWTKKCSVPPNIRNEVLKEVLLHTSSPKDNEIKEEPKSYSKVPKSFKISSPTELITAKGNTREKSVSRIRTRVNFHFTNNDEHKSENNEDSSTEFMEQRTSQVKNVINYTPPSRTLETDKRVRPRPTGVPYVYADQQLNSPRDDNEEKKNAGLEDVSPRSITKSPRNRFYESRFSKKQLFTTPSKQSTTSKSQLLYHSEAVGDNSRFPYIGWQNKNEESYDEGRIAPFRPILSRPTKPPLMDDEEQETLSMTSRDKARIFQMKGEVRAGSRLNSKFRDSDVRSKIFPVRRKNEETHSVNSANMGNSIPTAKPTSFQQNSEKKTIFDQTNDNKFPDNILPETINGKRSQEKNTNIISSSENITASPTTNDDVWRKESESKSTNIYDELWSESKKDDSISVRGRESDITKSQPINPQDFTNQTDSLPSSNSNDANSNHNQLQIRVSLFETQSQNSSNIIYPNTDDVSSATIFLPTAPTFSINKTEPKPATNSTEESTIIQAIFQQVDGLDQNTEDMSKIIQNHREEGRKFVPNNIFDVIDHVGDDKYESQSAGDVSISTEGENVTESSETEATSVKSNAKEDVMGTMCDQYQDKKDKIRCKVIACFRDSKLCFK